MSTSWRRGEYRRLLRELATPKSRRLLQRLQWDREALRAFATWENLIDFMQAGEADESDQDRILRSILAEVEQRGDPTARTALLALFWPGLAKVFRQRRRWDRDPDELWSTITWVFLRAISKFRTARRPERIASKLINDAYRDLHREYRRRWRFQNGTKPLEDEDGDEVHAIGSTAPDPAIALVESRHDSLSVIRAWAEATQASQVDVELVVRTRLLDELLADVAEDLGLGYEAAKKRRQRTEASLQSFANRRNL